VAGDVTSDDPIRAYLARLDAGLPGGKATDRVLAEVEDGLRCAVEDHVRRGVRPERAIDLALTEFGDAAGLAAELAPVLVAGEAHRDGLALLATGPVIGAGWLAAAALARPAAPLAVTAGLIGVGLVLVATVPRAAYAVATTGRLRHLVRAADRDPARAVRAVSTVARTVVALDAALLLAALPALLLLTPAPLMATVITIAAALSLARLVTAARTRRRLDRSRGLLTPA
jgi:hypothetical protein